MTKQTIAIDIDDVLAGHAEAMVKFGNELYGTSLTIDDYNEHFAVMWRTEKEETERRALEWLTSGHFRTLPTVMGAKEVLAELHTRFKLVVLTSRRNILAVHTREWLDTHFAGIFDEVALCWLLG